MKNDIDYMLSVMQAYKEGKEIEICIDGDSDNWGTIAAPLWNWEMYNYRVKKAPAYRPYKNKNEFLVDSMNNWFYICLKKTGRRFMPTSVTDDGIEVTAAGISIKLDWKTLFYDYEWDNGDSCGTEK